MCCRERPVRGGGKRGRGTTTATTTAKGTGNKSASSLAECLPPPPSRPPSPRPPFFPRWQKSRSFSAGAFLLPTWLLCHGHTHYATYEATTHTHTPPSPPPCTTHSDRANDRARISAGVPPLSRRSSNYRRNPSSSWCLFSCVCAEGALKVVESRGRKRSRGSPPPCPRVRACMGGREGGLISYS